MATAMRDARVAVPVALLHAALLVQLTVSGVAASGGAYFLTASAGSWTESRDACVAANALLAVIHSAEENAAVRAVISPGSYAHIGVSDVSATQPSPRSWQWCVGKLYF